MKGVDERLWSHFIIETVIINSVQFGEMLFKSYFMKYERECVCQVESVSRWQNNGDTYVDLGAYSIKILWIAKGNKIEKVLSE